MKRKNFKYDIYYRNNFAVPLFIAATLLFCLAMSVAGFKHLNGNLKYAVILILLDALVAAYFFMIISPLLRGGIYLISEKEEDAVSISGVVEDTFELPAMTGIRYFSAQNHGWGEGLVINGTDYYLAEYGNIVKGDEVSARVLPKSKLILEISADGDDAEDPGSIINESIWGSALNRMAFDYRIYLQQNCMSPIFASFICILFIGFSLFSIAQNLRNGDFVSYLGKNYIPVITLLMAVSMARSIYLTLSRGGIYLLSEKEEDAVDITGEIESTFEISSFMSIVRYYVPQNQGRGEGIVVDGTKYYLMTYGDLRAGDKVIMKALPKSKFVLEIARVKTAGNGAD